MTKAELFQALLDGKKVRDEEWQTGCFVYLSNSGDFLDEDGDCSSIDISSDDEYELYEESKPIVMRAQYAYKRNSWERACITIGLYKNDEDFLASMNNMEWYKRLDEIECGS